MFMFTDGGEQISVMGGNLTADGGSNLGQITAPPHRSGCLKKWGGDRFTSDFDGGEQSAMGGRFQKSLPPKVGGIPTTML